MDVLGSLKAVLDIEQNGRGLFRQGLRHQRFELRYHLGRRLTASQFPCQHVAEQPTLIHGQCGDYATTIGDGVQAGNLAGRQFDWHVLLPLFEILGTHDAQETDVAGKRKERGDRV